MLLPDAMAAIMAVMDAGRRSFRHGFGGRGEAGSSSGPKPVYQLCKKTGHTINHC
jgi:hypothetical protein